MSVDIHCKRVLGGLGKCVTSLDEALQSVEAAIDHVERSPYDGGVDGYYGIARGGVLDQSHAVSDKASQLHHRLNVLRIKLDGCRPDKVRLDKEIDACLEKLLRVRNRHIVPLSSREG